MQCNKLTIRFAAALSAALLAPAALGQWHTIEPLPGDQSITVRGISRNGNVVFGSTSSGYSGLHPFKWSPTSGSIALDVPDGYFGASVSCSNFDGTILGGGGQIFYAPNSSTDAPLRWTSAGVAPMTPLDPSFPGGDPFFCSPDGATMYGTAWGAALQFFPVRWDSTGVNVVAGAPGQFSGASDDGSVLAGTYVTGLSSVAWELTSSGLQYLPTLSPTGYTFLIALSGDGSVAVGFSQDASGIFTPVKWTSAGIEELPSFGPKIQGGAGSLVNSDGSLILYGSEGQTCIWTATGGTVLFKDYMTSHGVQGIEDVQTFFPMAMSEDGTTFAGQLLDENGYEFFYIRIGDPDHAPVANAGPDQSRPSDGLAVTLDGSGTTDVDGGLLTYRWKEGNVVLGTGVSLDFYPGPGHHVITLTVTDNAHLKSTDTVNIDLLNASPVVTLNGSASVTTNYGSAFVDPGATAFDAEDGALAVTVIGTVNTTAVGTYVVKYQATDSSGTSACTSRTVKVIYPWSGFNQPINMDGTSIFKLGSTVPVKFKLTGGASNVNIDAYLFLAKVSGNVTGTEMEAVSTSAADNGNQFRYSGGNYTFNLSTKGLTAGTWLLRAELGDGQLRTVLISLKP